MILIYPHDLVDSRLPEWVDSEIPYRGKCRGCGGQDARHRTIEAIRRLVTKGEDPADVAKKYHVTSELVIRICSE